MPRKPDWMIAQEAPAVTAPTFALHVGESYSFNFSGCPGGIGTFLGWTSFGWIALDRGDQDGGVNFYNPALLCTLRPESYPPEA